MDEMKQKVEDAFNSELDKIEKELMDTVDIYTYIVCKTKLFVLRDLAEKLDLDYRIMVRITRKLR